MCELPGRGLVKRRGFGIRGSRLKASIRNAAQVVGGVGTDRAALHGQTPTAEHLFADDTVLDPEERLLKANAVMHDFVWGNQMQLVLARLLDQAAGASDGPRELRRQSRRTEFIQTALAPARDRLDKSTYRKLCAALALVIRTESMVVFRDVLQIEEAEARVVEEWMIRVLTQAALLESRAREGKPLRRCCWMVLLLDRSFAMRAFPKTCRRVPAEPSCSSEDLGKSRRV